MIKPSLIITLLLASLTSTILTQDCNNPLLALYDLPGLEEPQSGADLPYCADLQSADTCCSADTVSTFQDRLDALINNLNDAAAGRDLYIAQLRDGYLDRFNDILEDIRDDHQDELQRIRDNNAAIADQLQADIDTSTQISTDARDTNTQFVGALDEYQTARSDCMTAALEVQTSSWCLACDPNYATQGVDADGNVIFSDGLCQALSDACTPFFTQGARFNPLIRVREAYWRLAAVARYLKEFAANGNGVAGEFVVPEDPYNPLASQQDVVVPDAATNTGACQNLWAGNAQLRQLLTIGATVPQVEDAADNADGARLLQDSLAGDEGVWAPDLTGTGLDFEGVRLDAGDFFGASDYSDYFNQTQNASDVTDNDLDSDNDNDNDDHTDNDLFDRSD